MPKSLLLLCLLCIAPVHAERDIVIEGGASQTQDAQPPSDGSPDIVIEGGSSETQPPSAQRPEPVKLLDCRDESALRSSEYDTPTRVEFVNDTTAERRTYWIDYGGKRVLYATLAPGESYEQQTYVTHPWVLTDAAELCVGIYLPQAKDSRVIIP
jgi:hypothetical protein